MDSFWLNKEDTEIILPNQSLNTDKYKRVTNPGVYFYNNESEFFNETGNICHSVSGVLANARQAWYYQPAYLVNRFFFKGCKKFDSIEFSSIEIVSQGSLALKVFTIFFTGSCKWKRTEYSIDGKTWMQTRGNPGKISTTLVSLQASPKAYNGKQKRIRLCLKQRIVIIL